MRVRAGIPRKATCCQPNTLTLTDEETAFIDAPNLDLRVFPVELALLRVPKHNRPVVKVSHYRADGGGTKRLLYHLARCYRELPGDAAWRPERRPAPPRPGRKGRMNGSIGSGSAWIGWP